MAIRKTFSVRNSTYMDEWNAYHRTGGIKIIVSPLARIAHMIGWLWGKMDTGDGISKNRPGIKSPSSYIIMGNMDDIWDDSK